MFPSIVSCLVAQLYFADRITEFTRVLGKRELECIIDVAKQLIRWRDDRRIPLQPFHKRLRFPSRLYDDLGRG